MDLQIILALVELFIYMFLGLGLVRWGIVKKEALKHFANFVFYVSMPSLIIASMANNNDVKADNLWVVVIMSFVLYGFLVGMGYVLPRMLKVDKNYIGVYSFMAIFGNVGFVGYPVIIAVLGPDALFYAAVFNIPFNILAFTLGVYLITMDTKKKGTIDYKKFINPGIIGTLIGLFLFLSGIQLPDIAMNVFSKLGNITTPLSLIVVGGSLVGVKITQVLKKHIIFIYSFIKLFLLPTLFAFVISAFGIEPDIAAVCVVIVGMPIAANTVILSQEYDGHVLEASEAVFISTLLIIFSIPYLIFLINTLF